MATPSNSVISQVRTLLRKNKFSPTEFANLAERFPAARDREQILYGVFTYKYPLTGTVKEQLLYHVSRDTSDWPLPRFLRMVRRTQAYLREPWAAELQRLPLPEACRNHQLAWRRLYQKESKLWRRVDTAIQDFRKLPVKDVLAELAVWIETSRWHNGTDQHEYALAGMYKMFVQLYFTEEMRVDKDALTEQIMVLALQPNRLTHTARFEELLRYYGLQVTQIQPYGHDENFRPDYKGHLEYASPEALEAWKKEGAGYETLRNCYLLYGEEAVSELESQISNGTFCSKEWASQLFLEDTCLDKLYTRSEPVKTLDVLRINQAYAKYCLQNYYCILEGYRGRHPTFGKAFRALGATGEKRGNLILPAIVESKKELAELFHHVEEKRAVATYLKVCDAIAFTPSDEENFDRHGTSYDSLYPAFINIAGVFFSPTVFVARNDWFYSIGQLAIDGYNSRAKNLSGRNRVQERRETALRMEKVLKKAFDGWPLLKASIPPHNWLGNGNGDVDVLVNDGKADLLTQVKRTKYRTTLQEAYDESINSDAHARNQIANAVAFLRTENDKYTLNEQHKSWVVSTSLEGLGILEGGVRKVNYYKLLFTLRYHHPGSLSDLIEAIENNWIDHHMQQIIDVTAEL